MPRLYAVRNQCPRMVECRGCRPRAGAQLAVMIRSHLHVQRRLAVLWLHISLDAFLKTHITLSLFRCKAQRLVHVHVHARQQYAAEIADQTDFVSAQLPTLRTRLLDWFSRFAWVRKSMNSRALGTSQKCRTPGLCRRVCEFVYSHLDLDVRGLAEPRVEAHLLLLAAGSCTKARVQRKAK